MTDWGPGAPRSKVRHPGQIQRDVDKAFDTVLCALRFIRPLIDPYNTSTRPCIIAMSIYLWHEPCAVLALVPVHMSMQLWARKAHALCHRSHRQLCFLSILDKSTI